MAPSVMAPWLGRTWSLCPEVHVALHSLTRCSARLLCAGPGGGVGAGHKVTRGRCSGLGLWSRRARGALRGLSAGCSCWWEVSLEDGVVEMHLEGLPVGPGLGDSPWGPCQNPQGRFLPQESGVLLCLPQVPPGRGIKLGRHRGERKGKEAVEPLGHMRGAPEGAAAGSSYPSHPEGLAVNPLEVGGTLLGIGRMAGRRGGGRSGGLDHGRRTSQCDATTHFEGQTQDVAKAWDSQCSA